MAKVLAISYERPERLELGYWIDAQDDTTWYQQPSGEWKRSAYSREELWQIATNAFDWVIQDTSGVNTPASYGVF